MVLQTKDQIYHYWYFSAIANTDIRILFEVDIAPNLNGYDVYTKIILICHAKLEIKLISLSANDTCNTMMLGLI
jgi:hypothetical protein